MALLNAKHSFVKTVNEVTHMILSVSGNDDNVINDVCLMRKALQRALK
jgi:hypothetical protein